MWMCTVERVSSVSVNKETANLYAHVWGGDACSGIHLFGEAKLSESRTSAEKRDAEIAHGKIVFEWKSVVYDSGKCISFDRHPCLALCVCNDGMCNDTMCVTTHIQYKYLNNF